MRITELQISGADWWVFKAFVGLTFAQLNIYLWLLTHQESTPKGDSK